MLCACVCVWYSRLTCLRGRTTTCAALLWRCTPNTCQSPSLEWLSLKPQSKTNFLTSILPFLQSLMHLFSWVNSVKWLFCYADGRIDLSWFQMLIVQVSVVMSYLSSCTMCRKNICGQKICFMAMVIVSDDTSGAAAAVIVTCGTK